MKLKNNSASKYEFSLPNPEGKHCPPGLVAVMPGAILDVQDDYPESMKLLHVHYPKDWILVEEPKKSVSELEAELAKAKAEEKAKLEAEKKAAAEAKKAAAEEAKARAAAADKVFDGVEKDQDSK